MPLLLPPELRPLLSASRALIPNAIAELGNPDWDRAERRILIARLSPFEDVARSSGHLVLFSECRAALPGAFIDFAFLPDRGDRELLDGRGLPWFFGAASGASPADYDLVMVSLCFSLELLNLPYLLSTAGIPLSSAGRKAARAATPAPLIILGGSGAPTAASLAAADGASMVDGLFFGEGEGAIGELACALSERAQAPEERLARARAVEGFSEARAADLCRATRRVARPAPPPLSRYPILNSPESSTARLQITAGCPGLCSFCLEGWDRRPYRELGLEGILAAALELKRNTGADSLEVYSFNFNTHARIFELLFELNRVFRRVGFMSQRVDAVATTPGLLRAELAADKRSFTLGVEGVSRRMRALYRKGLSDEDLDAAIGALLSAKGVRELKLFYIVSGFEDEADLAEFEAFAAGLGARAREAAPGMRILASAGYLVRLPATPLQYAPLALDEGPLSRIASSLRGSCDRAGIELRLAAHFDEYCADQLLSLGGPGLLPWLAAIPGSGFVYDGSLPRGAWPSLEAFARGAGLLGPGFLGEKDASWRAPVSFGDEEVLRAHYEEARAYEDREFCLGSGCSACGACDDPKDRATIGAPRTRRAPEPAYFDRLTRLMAAKAAFEPVYVDAELPAALAGATGEYRSSWLSRELLGASPGLERGLFEAREALFSSKGLEALLPGGFTGRTCFALYGPSRESLARAAAAAGLAALDALPDIERVQVEVEIPDPWNQGALACLRQWLADSGLSFVERREGEGRVLEPAARDLRKKLLYRAEILPGPGFRARLELGPKARLPDWLARLGRDGRAERAALTRVLSYSG